MLFSCKKCEVVLLFCSAPLKVNMSQSNFLRQRKYSGVGAGGHKRGVGSDGEYRRNCGLVVLL